MSPPIAQGSSIGFGLGAASVLGFAPFSLFPLPVLTAALLIGLWRDASPRFCAATGFAFGLGYFGFGVSWVYVSLHDFGAMPAPLSAIATLLFCATLAAFPAAAGLLQAELVVLPGVRSLMLIPALWTLTEWFRGWFLTGFPWLALGYSQAPPSPLSGYAPVLGVYGVSLATMASAGLACVAFDRASKRRRFISPALLLFGLWVGGYLLQHLSWTEPAGMPFRVSLLQGNIPQDVKWRPENAEKSLKTYLAQALASDARLIVLPETALPLFYHQVPVDYLDTLRRHAQTNQGDILIGLPEYARVTRGDGEYYNSVFSFGASPAQFYRKSHLVPFGEFISPGFHWVLNWLDIPLSDFSRGSVKQAPLAVVGQKVAVNICYEDVFGEEIIRQLPEATLLVNVSNVAWFGDSIAPWQHLQIAQMRALETGRVMLRATNTGMTAVIGPNGNVLEQAPTFQPTVLTREVQGYNGATPYVRFGNGPAIALALAGLGLACFASLRDKG
jgi:apolipoprotein N-acyltransferase